MTKTVKQSLIATVAELNKAIDTWGRQGQKWATHGHMLALSALHILDKSGDIGPANRLYLAMPKGTKSSAMGEWLLAFGKLKPTEGANSKEQPFTFDKTKANDLAGAAEKPWYEFRPEPEVVDLFDARKAMLAMLKSIRSKAAKAQTVTGLEALDEVERMLAPTMAEEAAGPTIDPLDQAPL